MRILKLARAILGTAITWGLAWIPFSLAPLALVALVAGGVDARVVALTAAVQGVVGAINGALFAGIVAVFGRNKTFDSISLRWIAACGAVGGALFPFVMRSLVFTITGYPIPVMSLATGLLTNAVLGAGFATASLALARRAPELPAGQRLAAIDVG